MKYFLALLVTAIILITWQANSKSIHNVNNNSESQQSGISIGTYEIPARNGTLLPGERKLSQLLPDVNKNEQPMYGANIFAGGYETERREGLNEDYLVAPGDKLQIWMWGAANYSDVVTVDNQGNIFIPNVGPVRVTNVKASNVNQLVTNKLKSIYKKDVDIYVNLLTSTPISLFITGAVNRPGQYAGMASDSVLYFLKRAGGIDPVRGSYRKITILRNGAAITHLDLYDFIEKGLLAQTVFKDNDVILVEQQGAVFDANGAIKKPFRFEMAGEELVGSGVLNLVKPLKSASHVSVSGNRAEGPFSVYLPLEKFLTFKVESGDKLYFNADQQAQVYDVEVLGSHLGPSFYTVDKGTKLHDILARIEIDKDLADFQSIYLLRKSVALKQKEVLEQSLDRLERSIFFSPSSSTGEATIKAQESALIADFIVRARKTRPLGKVVISDKGEVANITLEQNDKIVIPAKSDVVNIGGEVLVPQAVVINSKASIEDYVAWAGGYTLRADEANIVIVKANGLTHFYQSGDVVSLSGGDKIIVMPKVELKIMQAVKDITQIMFQLAITANAVK